MSRISLALAGAVVLLALAPSVGAVTQPRLAGTVKSDFTITLKRAGKSVTRLKRGAYSFVIADRTADHNFHLRGPGINRNLTTVAEVRTRTVRLRLRSGRYTFYCVPHEFTMRGSFRVT
jgi:hypothetical protein